MALLELRDVTVRFGGLTAVDDLSLKLHEGEIAGLIGPNGAGKTVTFNVITGLQEPDEGNVVLDGREITAWPAHERARAGIGRTFQVVQLFEGMSAVDNVMLAGHRFTGSGFLSDALRLPFRRWALDEAHERARAVLDFLDLGDLASRPVTELPIGQARLVELARAMALRPRVLLLDEPASGLDTHETADLVRMLAHIRAKVGCGILLVEHDMTVVMRLCDHVYVMDRGARIAAGPPDEVRDDPAVVESYLGAA